MNDTQKKFADYCKKITKTKNTESINKCVE